MIKFKNSEILKHKSVVYCQNGEESEALEDRKITELFLARSEQAIDELSKKYGALCTKIASNILGNSQDAEECVNDAFLGVWNSVPPQNPEPLSSYVCRIVRNLAIKKYRANTALKRNSFYDVALDEIENCFQSVITVEDEINANEAADAINCFLEGLDSKSRIMFIRRYWYSDSVEDIAKAFGTSRHNVSVRLSRIRKKLKKYLIEKEVLL